MLVLLSALLSELLTELLSVLLLVLMTVLSAVLLVSGWPVATDVCGSHKAYRSETLRLRCAGLMTCC